MPRLDTFLVHVFIFCVCVNIIPTVFIILHFSSFNYQVNAYVKKNTSFLSTAGHAWVFAYRQSQNKLTM